MTRKSNGSLKRRRWGHGVLEFGPSRNTEIHDKIREEKDPDHRKEMKDFWVKHELECAEKERAEKKDYRLRGRNQRKAKHEEMIRKMLLDSKRRLERRSKRNKDE